MTASTPYVFEKRSVINTSLDRLVAFHDDPGVFTKLAPPPIFIRVHRDDRTSLIDGEIEFTLWFGPIPIRWIARHQPGPTAHSFADLMVYGPLEYWRHEHIFEGLPDGTALTDRVTLAHKKGLAGIFTRLIFGRVPLHILFFYRHLRTRLAVRKQ